MKVFEINCLECGSTGNIMRGIADVCRENGIEVETFSGVRKSTLGQPCPYSHHRISSLYEYYWHSVIGKLTGKSDFITNKSTMTLVNYIKKHNPDIIHLHITHGCFINNKTFFSFLKTIKTPLIWTFHDCWAFTGRCPYYTLSQCNKWIDGCNNCAYPSSEYPPSFFDNTRKVWMLKKDLYCGISNLTIVTPSKWLVSQVKKSFLKQYEMCVINNGIDLNIFKPFECNFRLENQLDNRYIVLGVAFDWGRRKGLDVFIEMARRLDERFQIVLVGTNDEIDRKLPEKIISIHRTYNQKELAALYSVADLFVNPTREDNYPTVNMEAIACGTPVLTFKTGGSPEIPDSKTGYAVEVDDYDEMERQIIRICVEKPYQVKDCLERAKSFDQQLKFQEYVALFKKLSK